MWNSNWIIWLLKYFCIRGFTKLVPCCIGFVGVLLKYIGTSPFGFAGILMGWWIRLSKCKLNVCFFWISINVFLLVLSIICYLRHELREAENIGRKKPNITIAEKKERLTCHENSAANTSSQLKLLIKEVEAEEMHFPNWMLDLQSV